MNETSTEPLRGKTALRFRTWLPVLFIAVLFTLEMGIKNGELNQVFYLLPGLRKANPGFLAGDWFIQSAMGFHWVFTCAVAALARGGVLEFGLAAGTVLTNLTFAFALFHAIKAKYERPLLPYAATMMLFAGLFTQGLDHYLLSTSLEPFGVAGASLVAGIALLAWERPFAAGIALGIAGLVHVQFALLAGAALVLVILLRGSTWARRNGLALAVPFFVLASPTFVQYAAAAVAAQGGQHEAFAVLGRVAPQHYFPLQSDFRKLLVFSGTLLMGTGGHLLRPGKRNEGLSATIGAIAAIVFLSLFLSSFEPFWMVNQALPWRLSSILVLAALAVASAALSDPAEWCPGARRKAWGAVTLLLGLLLTAVAATPRFRLAAVVAAALPLVARRIHRRAAASNFEVRDLSGYWALSVVLVVGMLPVANAESHRSHVALRTKYPNRSALYHWIVTNSPSGGVFVVPPRWEDFRLYAQRALIADWWAPPPPLKLKDIIEWDRRLGDLSGLPHPRTLAEVERGYAALDCARVRQLAKKYDVGFVVLPAGRRLDCGKRIYADAYYTVLSFD